MDDIHRLRSALASPAGWHNLERPAKVLADRHGLAVEVVLSVIKDTFDRRDADIDVQDHGADATATDFPIVDVDESGSG